MKTQKFKRTVSLLLAMLMCVTTLFGMGTTAFAAEETDEVYLISYPRDGDANYGGECTVRYNWRLLVVCAAVRSVERSGSALAGVIRCYTSTV